MRSPMEVPKHPYSAASPAPLFQPLRSEVSETKPCQKACGQCFVFLYLARSSWFPSLGTHHCNECHSSSVSRQGLEPRVLIIHCLFFHVVQHPRYPQGTISKISGQWQLPWYVYGLSKWFKGRRTKRPQGRRPLFGTKTERSGCCGCALPTPSPRRTARIPRLRLPSFRDAHPPEREAGTRKPTGNGSWNPEAEALSRFPSPAPAPSTSLHSPLPSFFALLVIPFSLKPFQIPLLIRFLPPLILLVNNH